MKLVWKLLRQHISIPQFLGFFFANLVGMVIILLGVQFYNDYQALDKEDSFMKSDYLIVNKKISALSGLTGKTNVFTKDDVEDLEAEEFVERIGAFTPSSFNVRARFDVEGFVKFSTDMFFESVPDDFVDVKWPAYNAESIGRSEVPIILPRSYLALYNFGFAQSKNLPRLSEGVISMLDMTVVLRGNGIEVFLFDSIDQNAVRKQYFMTKFFQFLCDFLYLIRKREATTDTNFHRLIIPSAYEKDQPELVLVGWEVH